MINGVINVKKEAGFTSFDVVAKLRGILKMKKIGHTGTLDPDATGVLPVCLGKATKLCDLLTDRGKSYRCVLLLGKRSDTLDASGEILEEKDPSKVTEEDVLRALEAFRGEILQVPPMYSALKVNGKKLCDLARQGVTVERRPRPVTIHDITIVKMDLPRVEMDVTCSKGTYIRTLCDDIGQALKVGGLMESLVRTSSGAFTLDGAHTLSEIEAFRDAGRLSDILIPIDEIFSDLPAYTASKDQIKKAVNGSLLEADLPEGRYRVYLPDGAFVGLYTAKGGTLKLQKMFYSPEEGKNEEKQ